MKRRLGSYWRNSITILFCFCVSFVYSQDTSRLTEEIKEIKFWDFDTSLAPAQHIYGDSWVGNHIDSPAYDAEKMSWGYLLDLVEDSCEYVHPFKGVITSNYGWRRSRWHKGIDIDLEIGDPVYAAFDGVVRIQRYNAGGFGNYVLIRHYNGLETIYGHLSEAIVQPNQTVRAGQIIGFGGSTGRSTGSHLHFETRLMGQAFNPAKIIDFKTFTLKQDQAFINNTWFPYIKGSNTKANVQPPGTKRYYKIKSGDTLGRIAKRNGVSINSLCRMNRISRTTTLRIGRTLRVR